MPISPLRLLFLAALLGMVLVLVQVNLLVIAFDKLGLSPAAGLLLVLGALFGSAVNLPVVSLEAEAPDGPMPPLPWLYRAHPVFHGRTLVAINVGGCIIPLIFSLYLVFHSQLPLADILASILVVTMTGYLFSRPVRGLGIVMPLLLAPVFAAFTAILINPAQSAPLAYIGGTMGVLIGADLLHMREVRRMGAPLVSIGGAGTFDGIFLTGIVAALLA